MTSTIAKFQKENLALKRNNETIAKQLTYTQDRLMESTAKVVLFSSSFVSSPRNSASQRTKRFGYALLI